MKVAIPTNDQIKISKDILNCKGFLIYEVDNHALVDYEFHENPKMNLDSEALETLSKTLKECSTIICAPINSIVKTRLKEEKKQILVTMEENAKKALINLMCRV